MHLVGVITKKFVTMHGEMNVKTVSHNVSLHAVYLLYLSNNLHGVTSQTINCSHCRENLKCGYKCFQTEFNTGHQTTERSEAIHSINHP